MNNNNFNINFNKTKPGPGDYDPKLPRTITGGVIGTAGSNPSFILSNNSSPGPGTYNLSSPVKSTGTGVIPFTGRGKTNTDILISNSKLLPGIITSVSFPHIFNFNFYNYSYTLSLI